MTDRGGDVPRVETREPAPKRSRRVLKARAATPPPPPSRASERCRPRAVAERTAPSVSAPALKCQGMAITELDLLKFVWALQSKGYDRLDSVGIELGYPSGAAAKILHGLAMRLKNNSGTQTKDVYSVSTFPHYYDELILMLRNEHLKKAGAHASLASHAWSQALELAATYGRWPEPANADGVDYAKICKYLASALRGVPPPTLDINSDKALKRSIQRMQANALACHHRSRIKLTEFMKPKLDQWREENAPVRRKPRVAERLEDVVPAGPTEPDSDSAGGDGTKDETKVPTLDERIVFALEHSPSLNPANVPLNLLDP